VQCSEGRFAVQVEPQAREIYRLHLSPSLGFGTRVKSVKVNGEDTKFSLEENKGEVRCVFSLDLRGKTNIEIATEMSILLDLSPHLPRIGDQTTGLKIIRVLYENDQLRILVEGLGGREYTMDMITTRTISSADEAEVESTEDSGKKIKISFDGQKEVYSRKEIIIQFN